MKSNFRTQVFVVDNDPCIRNAIALNLTDECYECTCFENADDCLRRLRAQNCDLLITDIRMPGKSGIELLYEVKRTCPWLPVIVMSGYGDVPLAVKAVKAGAIDFIEKPIEWDEFASLIRSILKQNDLNNLVKGKPLTKMEIIVLRLILQGRSNRKIAQILHRSIRTVEEHRSHIMHKLDVDNVVDLVKRATVTGLDSSG